MDKEDKFELSDMFTLDKFLTPKVLLVLYWIALVGIVIGGFVGLIYGLVKAQWMIFVGGILAVFLGPFVVRLLFESMVLFYKIYERL